MPVQLIGYLDRRGRLFCLSICLLLAACQSGSSPTPVPEAGEAPTVTRPAGVRLPPVAPVTEPGIPAPALPEFTNLWDRIVDGFGLTAYYSHPAVEAELENFSHNQAYFDLVSERARPFLFSMLEELERRQLPSELILLPFIESAFNPSAVSNQRAVGLWQFVGPTARMLGLQQDWWYDGRRDPIASTGAALDYLQELYLQFDKDWLLAIGAYNAGEGNMRRALRQDDENQREFFSLRLPGETRLHVPRLLALARVIATPSEYGVQLPEIPNTDGLKRVYPGFQLDLSVAAEAAGIELATLQALNPGYLQWATHPDHRFGLLLPADKVAAFTAAADNLPPAQRMVWDSYLIQSGDTLSGIAAKLGTSVDVLQRVNGISGSRIIAGRTLLVPRTDIADSSLLPLPGQVEPLSAPQVPEQYRVRRGDNLWLIARRFDLFSRDIASWNGISVDSVLRPGQVLRLQGPAAALAAEAATSD